MAGAYIIVKIPQNVLEDAARETRRGEIYTLHIETIVEPKEICFDAADDRSELPTAEIRRMTSEKPVTELDIENAKKGKA